jgi:hypothetical protein
MNDSQSPDPAPAAGASGEEPGIDAVAARYLDGVASPADVARLEAALAADPSARRVFLALCTVDSALDERAAEWRESLAAASGGAAAWTAAADRVASAAGAAAPVTAAAVTPADSARAGATITVATRGHRLLAAVTAAVAVAACLFLLWTMQAALHTGSELTHTFFFGPNAPKPLPGTEEVLRLKVE